MKIENAIVKSFEKRLVQTADGSTEKYIANLENAEISIKIIFGEKPEQVFVPNEKFTITLQNPQKKLGEKNAIDNK